MFPAGEEPVVHYESIVTQGISLQWFRDNYGGALPRALGARVLRRRFGNVIALIFSSSFAGPETFGMYQDKRTTQRF